MHSHRQAGKTPIVLRRVMAAAVAGMIFQTGAYAQPAFAQMGQARANEIARNGPLAHSESAMPFRTTPRYGVVQTINGITTPHGVNVLPIRDKLWVANVSTATASRINVATGAVEMVVPVGKGPDLIVTDKLREKTWVTNLQDNSVSVLNTITGIEVQRIPVGNEPHGLAIDQARGLVYVANYKDDTVWVFDAKTLEKLRSITLGKGPRNIVIDSVTGNLFVSNMDEDTVSYVNPQRGREITKMKVGHKPAGLDFNIITRVLYVSNTAEGNVSVLRNGREIERVTVGSNPRGIQVNLLKNVIFVNVAGEGAVAVLDGDTNRVTQKIKVGEKNYVASLDLFSDTLFVANQGSNSISAITNLGKRSAGSDASDGPFAGFFERDSNSSMDTSEGLQHR